MCNVHKNTKRQEEKKCVCLTTLFSSLAVRAGFFFFAFLLQFASEGFFSPSFSLCILNSGTVSLSLSHILSFFLLPLKERLFCEPSHTYTERSADQPQQR